jgi:hypothetical protein
VRNRSPRRTPVIELNAATGNLVAERIRERLREQTRVVRRES